MIVSITFFWLSSFLLTDMQYPNKCKHKLYYITSSRHWDKVNKKKLQRYWSLFDIWIFSNTNSATVEVFVALDITLNATQRLQLINGFYNGNINLNSSYALEIQMIINENTKQLGKFDQWIKKCMILIDFHNIF
jgi:hypothetical protein